MALSTRSTSRPTLDVTRARQGRLGRHVLWMLLIALALVVLGFFATWTWKAGDFASVQPRNSARQVDAANFAAPEPRAATRQNYTTGGPVAPQAGAPGQPQRSNTTEP